MFISQPLRLLIADCAVLKVISNIEGRYAITLLANVTPR
jgi:hypothetical protein